MKLKINRRDFLKSTAITSLYFAGFGLPSFANSGPKKKSGNYNARGRNGWTLCNTNKR